VDFCRQPRGTCTRQPHCCSRTTWLAHQPQVVGPTGGRQGGWSRQLAGGAGPRGSRMVAAVAHGRDSRHGIHLREVWGKVCLLLREYDGAHAQLSAAARNSLWRPGVP